MQVPSTVSKFSKDTKFTVINNNSVENIIKKKVRLLKIDV
jgi:hypothetical protein